MADTSQTMIDPESIEAELVCTALFGADFEAHREFRGRLIHETEEGERSEAGRFMYHDFDVMVVPEEDNSHAFHTMDGESQETYEVFEALEANVEDFSDAFIHGIVYLKTLVVEPCFRNQGIAAAFLDWFRKQIAFGGRDSSCIAVIPTPLDDAGGRIEREELSAEEQAAFEVRKERLVALYERAGFRRVGETGVWCLSLVWGPGRFEDDA